ncbi:MAG: sigma-70 family RNA polymerase sigma factor, partial [Ruminococcus sp.]|nr:sigma-70 family RNA polymerase sigma factor [Ruminococcus sp.]
MMTDIEVQYRELLEEYSDTVTRLCLIHTGNKADAEDCYQNVFFKLFKAL